VSVGAGSGCSGAGLLWNKGLSSSLFVLSRVVLMEYSKRFLKSF
jgi:hypothetical protein